PLFPFGYGLTYSRFAYSDLKLVRRGHAITASFTLRNTGDRAAAEVAQLYVSVAGSDGLIERRLAGWQRVELRAGESRRVAVALDSHMLQLWNAAERRWQMPAGTYRVHLAASATDDRLAVDVAMPR